eukprot:scaffold2800_cov283-Chaetoceros_neogracile.AAC.12
MHRDHLGHYRQNHYRRHRPNDDEMPITSPPRVGAGVLSLLGAKVGDSEGDTTVGVGLLEGFEVVDGEGEGLSLGNAIGCSEGLLDREILGEIVDIIDGEVEGLALGSMEGLAIGEILGIAVGCLEGIDVGRLVGKGVC